MTQIRKLKKYLTALLMNFAVFFMAAPALAAELYADTSRTEYKAGDIFIANLKIDVQGECVNTVKADIGFPNNLLEAEDFIKSDSVLIFWVEEPRIDQNSGLISFAGGVPGGYCGKISGDSGPGNLIGKIAFKVKDRNIGGAEPGIAEIKFLDTSEVLLNDGLGTKANLAARKTDLKILDKAGSVQDEWQKEKAEDNIPPEPFTIEIHQDRGVFEGKYFIIFNAFDKQTGVDRYEAREGGGQWIESRSPYLLKDQNLKSLIEVKAIDKAGNERLAEFNRQNPGYKSRAKSVSVLLDILLILALAGLWTIVQSIVKKLKAAKGQNGKS